MTMNVIRSQTAEAGLTWMKQHRPHTYKRIIAAMKELAAMPDPRRHKHVKPLVGNLAGAYRLALYDVGIRVLFFVLQESNGHIIEIHEFDSIDPDAEAAIEVFRAGYRDRIYEQPQCENALRRARGKR